MVASGVDPSKISFTGHSLGGALATIIAMYTGHHAVVFDPAPNLAVAKILLGSGTIGAWDSNGKAFWPPILGLHLSESEILYTRQALVERHVSYGDPLDLSYNDSYIGNDKMAGVDTYYHLKFDRDVFIETAPEFLETAGTGGFGNELHSIYLATLQTQLVTSGFAARAGWVDVAANDNLSPSFLTRRLAA